MGVCGRVCVCVHGMCHAFASKCLIKVFSESSTDSTRLQECIDLNPVGRKFTFVRACRIVSFGCCEQKCVQGKKNHLFRKMEIVSVILFFGLFF